MSDAWRFKHIKRDKSWLQDDKLYIIDYEDPRNLKVYKKIIRPEFKKQVLEKLIDLYHDTRRFDIMLGKDLKEYDVKVVRTIRLQTYNYPPDCITRDQKRYFRDKHKRRENRKRRNRKSKNL